VDTSDETHSSQVNLHEILNDVSYSNLNYDWIRWCRTTNKFWPTNSNVNLFLLSGVLFRYEIHFLLDMKPVCISAVAMCAATCLGERTRAFGFLPSKYYSDVTFERCTLSFTCPEK